MQKFYGRNTINNINCITIAIGEDKDDVEDDMCLCMVWNKLTRTYI